MAETYPSTNKYLDGTGLKKYDELIKTHISNKITEVNNVASTAVQDVKIGGTSIVVGNAADIPQAASGTLGVVDLAKFELTVDEKGEYLTLKYNEIGLTSTIKYSDLVKDGILENVELITIPDDEEATTNRPAGTYLKFVFNTVAEKEAIYVNVTELIDIYALGVGTITSGSYVKLTASITGTGKSSNPWKLNITVDDSALNPALKSLAATHAAGNVVINGTTLSGAAMTPAVTLNAATSSLAGVMSATDKKIVNSVNSQNYITEVDDTDGIIKVTHSFNAVATGNSSAQHTYQWGVNDASITENKLSLGLQAKIDSYLLKSAVITTAEIEALFA